MKFLIDMNLSPLWAPFLAGHGYEGVHWSAIGDVSAPDSEILQYAAEYGYVVFTHDLDFGMLLAAPKLLRPSVIQVRSQDVMPSALNSRSTRARPLTAPSCDRQISRCEYSATKTRTQARGLCDRLDSLLPESIYRSGRSALETRFCNAQRILLVSTVGGKWVRRPGDLGANHDRPRALI
jgi:predicted nuclease of predicted toxin-antitoxin system